MTTHRDPHPAFARGDVVTFFVADGSWRAGVVVQAYDDATVEVEWYDLGTGSWVTDRLPTRRCHRMNGAAPRVRRRAS